MNTFLALLLAWFPLKADRYDSVAKLEIIWHEYPCDYGAWTGPDNRIHLCPAPGDDLIWLISHEAGHILAGHNLPRNTDWDKFAGLAMMELRQSKPTKAQMQRAKEVLAYGGHELHAELPWITKGHIPQSLARWYPWLEVEPKRKTGT